MRIVYLGNNDRGVKCLEALLAAGHDVAGVVAHPDPPVKPWYASVKETALSLGIRVIQPVKVSKEADTIRGWAPELLVLVGYTQIIRRELIDAAPLGAINLHGGRLPEYRGASVLNWQIINGETEGGVSIIQVDEGVDTGDVLAEERFGIGPDDTIRDVLRRSLEIFPPMLVRVLKEMESGTLTRTTQNPKAGRTWPKRHPADGVLNWAEMTAQQAHNMVRALTRPYPGASSHLDGRKVLIWKSRLTGDIETAPPGRVIDRRESTCVIVCKDRPIAVWDITDADGQPIDLPTGCQLGR